MFDNHINQFVAVLQKIAKGRDKSKETAKREKENKDVSLILNSLKNGK